MKSKYLPKYVLFDACAVGIGPRALRGILHDARALKVPIAVKTEGEKMALLASLKEQRIEQGDVEVICLGGGR